MFDLVSVLTSVGAVLIRLIVIVIAGLLLAGAAVKLINRSKKIDETAKSFFASFASLSIKILTVITALLAIGIPATTFVTVLGSVGLAIGLAMQGALSNFAGGILIVVFHPFRVNDYITVSGQSGVVKSISIFYTTIVNDDNVTVMLPNGTLTNAAIVNTSVEANRKLSFEYALPYDTDVDKVRSLLVKTASENGSVLSEPVPAVTVTAHGGGTVTVKLTAWTSASDYGKAVSELTEEIKHTFDENGITR